MRRSLILLTLKMEKSTDVGVLGKRAVTQQEVNGQIYGLHYYPLMVQRSIHTNRTAQRVAGVGV